MWSLLLLLATGCGHRPPANVVGAVVGPFDVDGPVGSWAPDPTLALVPVGRWVRVGNVVAFTYFDPTEGLSAQWRDREGVHIRRLAWAPAGLVTLDDAERTALGLPSAPDWLAAYGPQPPAGTLHGKWRDHELLRGRLHPDFPDDLRVVVGEVEWWEVVWVRIRSCDEARCDSALLNQPDRVPGLTIGSSLWFDLSSTPPDRLPVASVPGAQPDPAFITMAATHPALAGFLQDVEAWTVDESVPAASRLVPIGSWGWVGSDLVYFYLDQKGPAAAVMSTSEAPSFQSLTWLPRGYRPITGAEKAQLGLPETITVRGAPKQPAPGPWGTWRVDEATSWMFRGGDPDLADALILGRDHGRLRIHGCDETRCWGALADDAAGLSAGTVLAVGIDVPPGIDRTDFVPVAELFAPDR